MSTNHTNVLLPLHTALYGDLPKAEIVRIAIASANEMQRTIERLEERLNANAREDSAAMRDGRS